MPRQTIKVGRQRYVFSPEGRIPAGGRFCALVKVRLVDAVTGKPPGGGVIIQAKGSGFVPRVAGDGIVGLSGIPIHLFPDLTNQDYPVRVTVSAEGYNPREIADSIPRNPNFPETFMTKDMGDIFLHHAPIVIRGRVARAAGGPTSSTINAKVRTTGIWLTLSSSNTAVPPEPPNIVSLHPPLYRDRSPATDVFHPINFLPVAGNDKLLLDGTVAGDDKIRLSNRQNIVAGTSVLLIDMDHPDIAEYIGVQSISSASMPDQPALFTLAYPMRYSHRQNALVRIVNIQAPALPIVDKQFSSIGLAGDPCVFLNNLTDLLDSATLVPRASGVEIVGATGPGEYHLVSHFSVNAGADGYYRLPPLSGVGQLKIEAGDDSNPPKTSTMIITINYGDRENHLDCILR
jgi:hypothetical protein